MTWLHYLAMESQHSPLLSFNQELWIIKQVPTLIQAILGLALPNLSKVRDCLHLPISPSYLPFCPLHTVPCGVQAVPEAPASPHPQFTPSHSWQYQPALQEACCLAFCCPSWPLLSSCLHFWCPWSGCWIRLELDFTLWRKTTTTPKAAPELRRTKKLLGPAGLCTMKKEKKKLQTAQNCSMQKTKKPLPFLLLFLFCNTKFCPALGCLGVVVVFKQAAFLWTNLQENIISFHLFISKNFLCYMWSVLEVKVIILLLRQVFQKNLFISVVIFLWHYHLVRKLRLFCLSKLRNYHTQT